MQCERAQHERRHVTLSGCISEPFSHPEQFFPQITFSSLSIPFSLLLPSLFPVEKERRVQEGPIKPITNVHRQKTNLQAETGNPQGHHVKEIISRLRMTTISRPPAPVYPRFDERILHKVHELMLGGSRWSNRFLLLLTPTRTRLRTAVAQRLGALQEAGASLAEL